MRRSAPPEQAEPKESDLLPGLHSSLGQNGVDAMAWTVSRIEIRTSMSGKNWPVARVELTHPRRGRVCEIGTAPGAFDAIYQAASEIVGVAPRLQSFVVRPVAPVENQSLSICVEVELEIDGCVYRGTSFGVDLVRCSLIAWLQAASRPEPTVQNRTSTKDRRFQVSSVDENGDLWVFASSDMGAVEAVETEFLDEGNTDISWLDYGSAQPELERLEA